MPILEDLKEYAERATALRRPGKRSASALARARKPHAVRFKDDGLAPNHPRWPLIIYRGAVDLGERHDPAAVIEDLLEANEGRRRGHSAGRYGSPVPVSRRRLPGRGRLSSGRHL